MAESFSREWVSTLSDKADKAAKSQSVKDLRELKSAITREINAMKSYRKYYAKTYGKAGTEYKSSEFQYLKKAEKQLLQVREQIANKISDPAAHRVQYFKILNLEKEAKAKFEQSFRKDVEENGDKYVKVSERVKAYAAANVDKIFIDMFDKTNKSDFQMLGKALKAADAALNKVGMSVTDEVKSKMTDKYEELSSGTAFAIVADIVDEYTTYIESDSPQYQQFSEEEIKAIKQAIDILKGAL